MKTFREIALTEAKNPKTSLSGTYYIQKVQDMINWCENQKEWVKTEVFDDGAEFEVSFNSNKAALNKVRSIRKQFDDIIKEHGNSEGVLTIILDKKEVLLRKKQEDKKRDSNYVVYHNTYSAAINAAEKFAADNGYALDDETDPENIGAQRWDVIATGPSKPKPGKTNKFILDLYKGSKKQKVTLNISVYNRGTNGNEFELTTYIN